MAETAGSATLPTGYIQWLGHWQYNFQWLSQWLEKWLNSWLDFERQGVWGPTHGCSQQSKYLATCSHSE
jgi:hypothetical protein